MCRRAHDEGPQHARARRGRCEAVACPPRPAPASWPGCAAAPPRTGHRSLSSRRLFAGSAQEMKPEWTKTLTPDNFNDWIKGEVDAGRTAFVRWIASEGWCAPPIRCPSRQLFANRPEACARLSSLSRGGSQGSALARRPGSSSRVFGARRG